MLESKTGDFDKRGKSPDREGPWMRHEVLQGNSKCRAKRSRCLLFTSILLVARDCETDARILASGFQVPRLSPTSRTGSDARFKQQHRRIHKAHFSVARHEVGGRNCLADSGSDDPLLQLQSAAAPEPLNDFNEEDRTLPLISASEREKRTNMPRKRSRMAFIEDEKTKRNILGTVFLVSVTVALILNFDTSLPSIHDLSEAPSSTAAATALSMESAMGQVTEKLVEASLPGSATDVAAVALGEGTAGVLGAGGMLLVKRLMSVAMQQEEKMLSSRNMKVSLVDNKKNDDKNTDEQLEDSLVDARVSSNRQQDDSGVSDVLAGGDYFLTRSAMLPLLEGIGVPMSVANVASVLLAMIPYQFLRINNNKRRRQKEFNQIDTQRPFSAPDTATWTEERNVGRLGEERKSEQSNTIEGYVHSSSMQGYTEAVATIERVEEKDRQKQEDERIDVVELFSDMSRWLEYDVLRADCSGVFFSTNPGVESAFFGFIAALSSQLYADLLYLNTDYGASAARLETRTRERRDWIALYANRCLSSAALFGVYETTRIPIRKALQELLSGGADGCVGSSNFNLCMQVSTTQKYDCSLFFCHPIVDISPPLVTFAWPTFTDLYAAQSTRSNSRRPISLFPYSTCVRFGQVWVC
jgi:hypothetical protein